ncbi:MULTISPECIES: DUF418 domain-containing protein [unclassified Sphingomonas]|uniref:DUF418 domain-containing protein n=1 Tax=unclassified Sphingomonas TaxID=196159 RepID=UPI0022B4E875|nr:DUF418 domain-containing protein [Sphingomonas sp. NIBR02145]WHU02851.1 DUF418 domain-containing protein [Sphingomonas sp. NIBR02145]
MNRPAGSARLASLDTVRGVAVLGILLLNILSFAMPEAAYFNPRAYGGWHSADLATWAVNFILFDGKMRGLFSFLFGASTLLVIERAEAGGLSPAEVHYRRMAWLLVFGIAHLFLVWHGDILAHYALVGMIAFAMRDMPVSRLIILGILLGLAGAVLFATIPLGIVAAMGRDSNPQALHDYSLMFGVPNAADIARELALHRGGYGPILLDRLQHDSGALTGQLIFFGPETLAYMLFGMAALRSGMLRGEWAPARYRRWLVACWSIALPAYALLAWWQWASAFDIRVVAAMMPLTALARPPMIAGWICLILLLARPGGRLTARLAAAGRMAFTNYLVTSLICTTLFYGYGLGWYGHLSRWQLYPVVFGIWAAILTWSSLWLHAFRFGPFEWLWRSLARWELQPLRNTSLRNNATASQ